MSELTREQIVSKIMSAPPKLERLHIDEWDVDIYLKPISLEDQGALADATAKYEKGSFKERIHRIIMPLICWSCCDSSGAPLFTEADVAALVKKGGDPFKRIQNAVLRISGLTAEAQAALEKNSETVQAGGISL